MSAVAPGAAGDGAVLAAATCPLCRLILPEATGPVLRDEQGRPVRYRRCPTCASLVPGPAPGDDGGQPIVEPDRHDGDPTRRLAEAVAADAATVAWQLADHLPAPSETDLVVDLGAGLGGLLAALARLGYPVRGCEPSSLLCQMARASHLLGPDVLANVEPDRFLDELEAGGDQDQDQDQDEPPRSAVVLWHVLDRVADPVDLLGRAARLAPGGLLFCEFPMATAEPVLAGRRFHPTPETVPFLADELDLTPVHAEVAERGGLRVFFRAPVDGVLDLEPVDAPELDLDALQTSFRRRHPHLDDLLPDPATDDEQLDRAAEVR